MAGWVWLAAVGSMNKTASVLANWRGASRISDQGWPMHQRHRERHFTLASANSPSSEAQREQSIFYYVQYSAKTPQPNDMANPLTPSYAFCGNRESAGRLISSV